MTPQESLPQLMIEAGVAAYHGWQGGNPRSHGEICEQIYLAMRPHDPELLLLREALASWMHIFMPTAEGGRDPEAPGWGQAIDDALALGRAALTNLQQGQDR